MRFASTSLALALALALVLPGGRARAGEIQVGTGPGAYASSWRGDATFGQALKLGYRVADLVAIEGIGRVGYGTVDERMLTYLSLGGALYGRIGRTRPLLRAALVHQHEEPAPGLRADPFGALFGVGDGIRHRAGFAGGLGLDVPVTRTSNGTEITAGLDTSAVWFPDPRGPKIYAGGSLWLGVNFGL